MDRIVKVPLAEEDVQLLDNRAKEEGIPRAYLVRRVIEGYLKGTAQGPLKGPAEDPAQVQTLTKALEEAQGQRESLQGKIGDLEKALAEKSRDLEWTRGQWASLNSALQEALSKIPPPRPALEDGRPRPSWWQRIIGGKGPEG